MENPEEILHSLEEFSKLKPKDIPRELEDYLCFVAKTGDPVYQWSAIKSLLREKLVNVITEFYESCPTVEIPPCPNVEMFNYDSMKNFILEKLDTFAAAPFTVQRICELLTTPRKEYNRIDKYMRALEKNILVVSTTEPANRRSTENGDGIVNGIETEHIAEANSGNDINVEEMDDSPAWPRINQEESNICEQHTENGTVLEVKSTLNTPLPESQESVSSIESSITSAEPSTSNADSVITCMTTTKPFVLIEPVITEPQPEVSEDNVSVTITAIPAPVQKRRNSIEPLTSDDNAVSESISSTILDDSTKETSEGELTAADNVESEPEESKQSTIDSINISNDNIDETTKKEKSTECEEPPSTEDESNVQHEEKETLHTQEEPTIPHSILENESETEHTCDNTTELKNTESCAEDPGKTIEDPITEETLKEETIPDEESVELSPKAEEINRTIGDTIEESAKEPEQNSEIESTPTDNGDTIEEKHLEETPMEVDSDENVVKESSTAVSSVETSPN